MKITLIEPRLKSSTYDFISRLPKLGALILGTLLKNKGYDVKIFSEVVKPIDWNRVLNSDLVGISTLTPTAIESYKIADKIKKHNKNIKIVFGGSHATFMPEEALEHGDIVVAGEGEETFIELVDRLNKNENIEDVRGIIFKYKGKVIKNTTRSLLQDINLIPDISLIDGYIKNFKKLRYKFFLDASSIIATSRGCPFNCKFCSVIKLFGRKYRFRDIDNVIQEIKQHIKAGSNKILFADDNFAANPKRTEELLKRIIKENIKIRFHAQIRADFIKHKGLIDLLKRAGCDYLFIGFESINQDALDSYNKNINIDEYEKCIKLVNKAGIGIIGSFVLGSDYDTKETIRNTADFAIKNNMAILHLTPLSPLPGTDITEELIKNRRVITNDWSKYFDVFVVFRPKNMKASVLQEEIYKAQRRFYSLKQIAKAIVRGEFNTAIFRIIALYILITKNKKRIYDHIKWLKTVE